MFEILNYLFLVVILKFAFIVNLLVNFFVIFRYLVDLSVDLF